MVVGRRAVALVAGVVLSAVVAGCTGGTVERRDGTTSVSPSVTPSSSPDPVQLSFAVYGPEVSIKAYQELADAFTAKYPHVTVDVSSSPSAELAMAQVRARTAGGAAPDVFLADHDHLPELVEEKMIQPVNSLLEARQVDFGDGYQRSGLTAFSADAALQCMPHDVSPLVVYYNKDLVDLDALVEEGEEPPSALDGWDWETFARAAQQAAVGPANGLYMEPSLGSIAPFVWSAGGDIVDDNDAPTTLTLAEGDARSALEQVLTLVRDPQVTPSRALLARRDALTLFERGRLGMILGTRELTPQLRDVEDLRFDVMPLPSMGRFRTISDMTGYCIAADTDEVEAAADFLAYAVSREGAAITTRSGYVVPSNLEVANSAAFLQPALEPESAFIFNEGVRRAQNMPYHRDWSTVSRTVQPLLSRLFHAPVIDLDVQLEQLDTASQQVLAPGDEGTAAGQ